MTDDERKDVRTLKLQIVSVLAGAAVCAVVVTQGMLADRERVFGTFASWMRWLHDLSASVIGKIG